MGLNRQQKRRAARVNHGVSLSRFRKREKELKAEQAEALTLSPEEARKKLVLWAASPDRTQEELDFLNQNATDLNIDMKELRRGILN